MPATVRLGTTPDEEPSSHSMKRHALDEETRTFNKETHIATKRQTHSTNRCAPIPRRAHDPYTTPIAK
eukprot:3883901-Rhodomonas_salina.5